MIKAMTRPPKPDPETLDQQQGRMLLLTLTLILTITLTLTLTLTLSINPNTNPNHLLVRRSGPQSAFYQRPFLPDYGLLGLEFKTSQTTDRRHIAPKRDRQYGRPKIVPCFATV